MYKFTAFFKCTCLILSSFILLSCSSDGGSGSAGGTDRIQPTFSSLAYSSDYLSISGDITLAVNGEVGTIGYKTIQVDITNFLTSTTDCTISDFSISPDTLTYTDNTSQTVSVSVSFFDQCFENSLELTADQTVIETTTLPLGLPDTNSSLQSLAFTMAVIDNAGTDVIDVQEEFVPDTIYPDQDSFSISAETPNPEGWRYDGVEVAIYLRAADQFNNSVSDGTIIYFTTEGGSIPSTCTTTDGICTVKWVSMSPRPADGRVTILATAIGSESFVDTNGNGLFDVNSSFTDLPEVFRDDNEDGVYSPNTDIFFDLDGNLEYSSGNGVFNGPLCTASAENSGLCVKTPVPVRASYVLTMSTSDADIRFSIDSGDLTINPIMTLTITVADLNGNPMPKDTVVKITTSAGKILDTEDDQDYLEYKIGLSNSTLPHEYTVRLQSNTDDTQDLDSKVEGRLYVKVTTPQEHSSSEFIPITDWEETSD